MEIKILQFKKFILVSIFLLAIISLGAVSAASDDTTADGAVNVAEELEVDSSHVSQIPSDSGDAASGSEVNQDSKLGAGAGDEKLSAGSVAPKVTVDVTPNILSGSTYVAQYGQIIKVNGTFENCTGNVTVRFGFSGNYVYHTVQLVDGKFSQEITDYDRVRNNYQIYISYAGDDYYKSATWSKNIHIQMNNVTGNGAYYGLNPYVDVNLFDATGNITLTLNGRNYTGKLENGKFTQEFTNYTIGSNSVVMKYEGDGKINPIERTVTFNVDANVDAPTIYNYQEAIIKVNLGEATGKVNITFNNKTEELNIVSGVATTELKGYSIGTNTFKITYSGDDTFNPFETTKTFTVLDKENAAIVSSVYQTPTQNFIFISIPHSTGTLNVTVNGKKEVWTIVNETAKKDINASDKITELFVSYEGNFRLNPTNSSRFVNLTDYIVNTDTFANYFNQADDGKLYDFIENGITLDFQGSIINPDTNNKVFITINKPVNIISSTGDAYIDLNTTAGSLLGENPGNCFAVIRGGSGSNISNIYLHNTELWIFNTTNVVFDNISVVVEDQRVGSGVGATTVRQNSSYVTIKNSYFYTRNNGGSTTFTFSWANYCTFDNNTVAIDGNVGNMLYLNIYNIPGVPTGVPVNTHNKFINNRLQGKLGSAISVGIMVEGAYNLIANNTLNKTSISTSFGGVGANNNTYYGNVLIGGGSITAQPYSILYNNIVSGTFSTGADSISYNNTVEKTMTVGARSEAYNNAVLTLTVSGASAVAYNNTVNGDMTVSGAGAVAYNNTVSGAMTVSASKGNIHDNTVNGAVTVSGLNATAYANEIGGIMTVSGNGVIIYNNTIGTSFSNGGSSVQSSNQNSILMSVNSNDVEIHKFAADSLIIGVNTEDEVVTLIVSGSNSVAYDNNVSGAMTVSGTNAVAHDNAIGASLIISGSGAKVYNQNASSISVNGKGAEVYNITANTLTVGGDEAKVHNAVINGTTTISSSSVQLTNNSLNGDLNLESGSSNTLVSENNISGCVKISSANNNLINNDINSSSVYAVDLESSANNNSLSGNKIYSKELTGVGAVKSSATNIVFKDNYPYDPNLTVDVNSEFIFGDIVVINININKNATGTVSALVDGEYYDINNTSNVSGNIRLTDLNAGQHVITVIFKGNGDYGDALQSKIITVNKYRTALEIYNSTEMVIGSDVVIDVKLVNLDNSSSFIVPQDKLALTIDKQIVYVPFVFDEESSSVKANYTITNISTGVHTIIASFNGTDSLQQSNGFKVVNLQKTTPEIDITTSDLKLGETVNVTVTIANAVGKVSIIVDGSSTLVDLFDGVANYTIEKLTAGSHTIIVNYSGDNSNNAASNYKYFSLEKSTPIVAISVDDLKLDGDANVTVTIVNATGKVNVIVDGVSNPIDLVDGVATYTIKKVTAGIHTIVANYEGDIVNNPASASTMKELKVLSTIFNNVSVDGDLNINAILMDNEGKTVANAVITYVIGNLTNTTVTDANGSFTIKGIENSKVSISYAGSDLLFPTSTVVSLDKISPSRVASIITASPFTSFAIDTAAGEKGAFFNIALNDEAGKAISNESITVVLDNKLYTLKTGSNGVASMQINSVNAGTHTAAVLFLGNTYNEASFTTAKLVINKKTTSIVAKASKFKAKVKTKKYTATLQTIKGSSADGKTYLAAGKSVTLTIKGKTFTAKTNNKGQVTFKITKLSKKGKYNAVISFAGDAIYNAASKKVKITVK